MSLSVRLRHVMGDFTLDMGFEAPGGIVALFGRSGAGKTSVVNAIAGLLRPDEGRVAVGGEVLLDTRAGICLPASRRGIGYVFQEGRLFPHMTVRRNLLYGSSRSGASETEFARVVELLGIGGFLDRRPGLLSGGEKQRVAIGRALLSSPRLLLMDEPLAALDLARKAEILPYLERLRDETRVPIVYVSHAVPEVARLADTVVVMEDGRVLGAGPAADVFADPDLALAFGAGGAGAILTARVVSHDAADGLTELEASGGRLFVPLIATAPGRHVRLRIEADDVALSRARPSGLSALNVLPARVTAIRPAKDGPGAIVALACGTDRLLAQVTRRSIRALDLSPGVDCFAILKTSRVARGDIGG